MIPDDVIDRVREHADIVAVVGELVKLKRVGNSFRGPCPFHQGKDPNFAVSPRGGYVCFVCHEKGDVFTFVQKRLGLDFVDAVKYVGAKSGVEVVEVSRERAAGPDPRERYWELNGAAAEYFAGCLWNEEAGAPARDYLEQRKLDRAAAERFGLGFAPRDATAVSAHLVALGYDDAEMVKAGLLQVREGETRPRPRFRGRLMFPIYDPQGRVIAFGGRVIGAGEPKYLNSPESPTFQKSTTLYGLNWAKQAIRRDERLLLVEGYFDCVRLMAAGIESVVAPLGTALTDQQAELIRKYTTTVFLLYDSDQAGLKATFRAGDALLRHGIKVHVVTLPEGEDPDTFVSAHGRVGLETQLSHALDVFERKLQIVQRGGWLTDLIRKRVALDRLLPTISAAADPITRGLYIGRAAEVVGVSQDVLERELRSRAGHRRDGTDRRRPEEPPNEPRTVRRPPSDRLSPDRELVRALLHRRRDIALASDSIDPQDIQEPWLATVFSRLVEQPDATFEDLVSDLDDEAIPLLARLFENAGGLEETGLVVQRIRQREIEVRLDEIDRQIALASDIQKTALTVEKTRLQDERTKLGKAGRWKAVARSPSSRTQADGAQ